MKSEASMRNGGLRRRAVAVTVVALSVATGSVTAGASGQGKLYRPLRHAERTELASVSPHTLATVKAGGTSSTILKKIHGPALSSGGKPEVLFIDAEFCPYCAAERWSLAVALSRFGTMSGLTTMVSSSTDVDPNTQTVSFRYAHFTSNTIAFRDIVNEDRDHHRIEPVPPKIKHLWRKYTRFHELSYPFVYFDGHVVSNIPMFDPRVLTGHSRAQIAASLNHPHSPIARAVDGGANRITAAICATTGDHPGRVCHSAPIPHLEKSFH